MFYKGEIPFVRLLVPLIVGISLGWIFPLQAFWGLVGITSLIGVLIIFILGFILYKRTSLFRYNWILGSVVHIFLFLIGYLLCLQADERYDPRHFTADADALGIKIASDPQSKGAIIQFEADVTQSLKHKAFRQVKGKLRVTLKADSVRAIDLSYGDVLLVPATFTKIAPPANPAEFDFRNHLAIHQIHYQLFLTQEQVKILQCHGGTAITSFALKLRKKLTDKIYTYLPNKENAALLSALIIGYRTDLSREVLNVYSQTGIIHVLAVSGMHVGILFLLLNFLLKPLNKNTNLQFIKTALIIFFVWFYALITGFSPSVCRAATMLSFIILGKTFTRNHNTYNLLAISAFLLLLYNPLNLFKAGFQLSYLAVVGLIYFHPKIYQLIYIKNNLLDSIWDYTILSIAAQLTTFPLSIYYFHQFPFYFLISNLFVVLPVTILMYLGLIFLLIPSIFLLKFLGLSLNWVITSTNFVLYHIQQLPCSSLEGIWINIGQCLLMYVVLICFAWLCTELDKKIFFVLVGLLIVLIGSLVSQVIQNKTRHELIFYSLRKNVAISHIYRGRGTLITNLSSTDKTLDFSIKPAIMSKGAYLDKVLSWEDSVHSTIYSLSPRFMQFGNFKILRWDAQMNTLQNSNQKINTDVVFLNNNSKVKLSNLCRNVCFSMLLIDGTSNDYHIQKWKKEADSLFLPYHILGKGKALVLKL